MFTVSYSEALKIQWEQIAWSRKYLRREGVKTLRAMTKPCPAGLHPDHPIDVFKINRLLPRGGSIESVIARKKEPQTRLPHFCASGKATPSHLFVFRQTGVCD